MAGWHLPDSTAPFSEVGMVGCLATYFMHASMGVHWTMWEWIGWSGRCLYRGSLDSIARNCGKWRNGAGTGVFYVHVLFPLFELFPSSQDINHLEHKHLVHLLRLEGLPASSSIHKSCNTFDPFRVFNCRTIEGREWEQRTWLEWLQLDFPSFPFRLTSLFPDNWDIRVLSSISISNKAKHSNWCDPKMRGEAGAHLHLSEEKNRN